MKQEIDEVISSTFVPSKKGVQSTADLADKNYDEVVISNIRPAVQQHVVKSHILTPYEP